LISKRIVAGLVTGQRTRARRSLISAGVRNFDYATLITLARKGDWAGVYRLVFRAPKSGLTGATRLSPDELATGQRLEQLLGKSLKESPHVGAEYVDDLGRTYDALGTPAASQYWNAKKFFKSIDGHLLKSNDFTVIDLTGFTPTQIAEVKNYLSGLSKAQLDKIIRIGF